MARADITLTAVDQTRAAFDSVKRNLGDVERVAGSLSSTLAGLGADAARAEGLAQLGDRLREHVVGRQGVGPDLGEQFGASDHRPWRTCQHPEHADRLGRDTARAARPGHQDLARSEIDRPVAHAETHRRRRVGEGGIWHRGT